MADESFEDGEFWLPPQFLEDDLSAEDSDSSDLSLPAESVAVLSDEEDCLAVLLRKKIAHSAPEGDLSKLDCVNCKGSIDSGSPKSIHGGGSDGYGPRRKLLPATLQVLYEASCEAATTRMSEQVQAKSDAGFLPHQWLSQLQLQAAQLQRMRQHIIQRRILEQHQVLHRGPPGLQWPPLQHADQKSDHQFGTPKTMRAVSVGAQGTRSYAGTGVFLPRQVGTQPEPRKKQACSSVLIPAKVAQARTESMRSQPQKQLQSRSNGRFTCEKADGERFSSKGSAEPWPVLNQEIQLPQEWTY